MKGLDTNILIRYLTQDDPAECKRANNIIEHALATGESLYLNKIVLCETVWVFRIAYSFDRQKIVEVLEKILSTSEFIIESKDTVRHAVKDYGSGPGDFSDHLIGLHNSEAGCSITDTFDRNLKKSALFAVH